MRYTKVQPKQESTKMEHTVSNPFPHFVIAVKNWSEENGFATHILCATHMVSGLPASVIKKHEHEINLDISSESSPLFDIIDEVVQFTTRFNGVETNVSVPLDGIVMVHSPKGGLGVPNVGFVPISDSPKDDEIILAKPKSKLRIVE